MKEVRVYIADIWESVEKIEDYAAGVTFVDFSKNSALQDAVIRRLEIIGETVKNIPPEVREKYNDIPWAKIAGMRDVLIHEYAGVNMTRIWKTINEDIPDLKNKLAKIKTDLKMN